MSTRAAWRDATRVGFVRLPPDVAAAVGLLTRVPIRSAADRSGAWAFGLVGVALGLAAAAPLLLAQTVGAAAAAVLALAVLAVASGALHLDGLADTADALAAPTADAAERARRDPRAGAAGVVSIVLVLGLDAALLATLAERAAPVAAAVVVAATAASRSAAVMAAVLAGGRMRRGLGGWFADRASPLAAVVAAATAAGIGLALAGVAGQPGPALAAGFAVVAGALAALGLARLRGGLDGDALGAVVELAFTGGLLAAVVR